MVLSSMLYKEVDDKNVDAPTKSIVIISSAIGILQRYYARFAHYLAENGHIVITFDYRGIGQSLHTSIKKCTAWLHEWGEKDMDAVILWAHKEYPDVKINMICHSIGGVLFGLAKNKNLVSNMISIASPKGYWKYWPIKHKPYMILGMFILLPIVSRMLGYVPGILLRGENLPKNVARQWGCWGRSADFILCEDSVNRSAAYQAYDGNILSYSFYDDAGFAPRAAVDSLLALYTSAKYTKRVHVESASVGQMPIKHFGFFRERMKPYLWDDILNFIAFEQYTEKI